MSTNKRLAASRPRPTAQLSSAAAPDLPLTEEYENALGRKSVNFQGGYITTGTGSSWEAFRYEPGRTAFVRGQARAREIYVMDASGLNELNLTRHPSDDFAPAWAPDGRRIAFISTRALACKLRFVKESPYDINNKQTPDIDKFLVSYARGMDSNRRIIKDNKVSCLVL